MPDQTSPARRETAAFICSRDTLDGAYPSLLLAVNARRLGLDVAVFYTFMGVNIIMPGGAAKARYVPSGPLGAIPGMSAVATKMMKGKIEGANIPSLDELLEIAQVEGVRLVACKMTVDMMGLEPSQFIEGVEIQTAEDFMKYALGCRITMFT